MGLDVASVQRQARINLSKISTSVDGVKNGEYVKVNEAIFSQPGITYAQREDGVITIMSNGQVIGFTIADENGMGNVTTNEAEAKVQAQNTSSPKENSAPSVVPTETTQATVPQPERAKVSTYDASSIPMPEVPNITVEALGSTSTS